MNELVIVSAVRSPIGRAETGSLAHTRPETLLSLVMKEALARVPQVDWHELGDVLVGCAVQEGEQGLNIGRQSAILAGLPSTVPAVTLNRYCASSLSAIMLAAAGINMGSYDIALAAGVEAMSRLPLGGFNPSPSPLLLENHPDALTPPGVAAENLARKYNISREDQDRYAMASHQKALAAWTEGMFASEIVPIQTVDGSGESLAFNRDDIPHQTSLEELGQMPTIFIRNGTVTAGNCAPASDGAAALMLMSRKKADELGVEPLAAIRAHAVVGCSAEIMASSAVAAAKQVMRKSETAMKDLALIEISEQFASGAISCLKDLNLENDPRVNACGGAIALGHPYGANGARMVASITHALRVAGNGKLGLVTIGAIGGQGEAMLLESLPAN